MILPLTARKNTAFTFSVGLWARNELVSEGTVMNTVFQNSPTLAAGDVKISIDNGSLANLTNLPTVTPPASKLVQVQLTAAEMNGDIISVIFSDVADNEWCDLLIVIRTSLRLIDDLTYPQYQVADAVATDGVRPTIEQALYEIRQFLIDKNVTGSTVTVRKPDGATTLATYTLNNPTTPTDITRN